MILKNELLASFCAHASGDLKRSPVYETAIVATQGAAKPSEHRMP